MQPDPAYPRENLYATPLTWKHPKALRTALSLDEAHGHVRPAFARWVRGALDARKEGP